MPIIKSAEKQMRKSNRARVRNRAVRDDFRNKVKAVKVSLKTGAKDIEKVTAEAVSAIDKAAKKGVIHQGTADRRKSRLMLSVNKALKRPVELEKIKTEKKSPVKKTAAKKTALKKNTIVKAKKSTKKTS